MGDTSEALATVTEAMIEQVDPQVLPDPEPVGDESSKPAEGAAAASDDADVAAADSSGEADVDFSDLLNEKGELRIPGDEETTSSDQDATANEALRQLLLTGDQELDSPEVSEKILGAALKTPNGQRLLEAGKLLRHLETELGYEPNEEETLTAFRSHQQHQQLVADIESANPSDMSTVEPVLSFVLGDKENPQPDSVEAFTKSFLPFLGENYPDWRDYVMQTAVLDFADRIEQSAHSQTDEKARAEWPKVANWVRQIAKGDSAPESGTSDVAPSEDSYWKQKYESEMGRRSGEHTDRSLQSLHGSVSSLVDKTFRPVLERGNYTDAGIGSIVKDLAAEVTREIAKDRAYSDLVVRQIDRGERAEVLVGQHLARARTVIKRMSVEKLPQLVKNFSSDMLKRNQADHERRRNGASASATGSSGGSAAEPRPAIEKRKDGESQGDFMRRALSAVSDSNFK